MQVQHHPFDGLRIVDISNNKIGDQAMASIIASITESEFRATITVLNISNNSLDYQTGVALRGLLQAPRVSLHTLNVAWNQIRDEGASELFDGLAGNSSVAHLMMAWNGLGSDAACAKLAVAMKSSRLEVLDISHCRMVASGMKQVADGLRESQTLSRLVLDGNIIGTDGARAMYKALYLRDEAFEAVTHVDVSIKDCNVSMLDGHSFNRAEPAGAYSLDMGSTCDRAAFEAMIELVKDGTGLFLPYPEPRIDVAGEGVFEPFQIAVAMEVKDEAGGEGGGVQAAADEEDDEQEKDGEGEEEGEEKEWQIPEMGILEFTFAVKKARILHVHSPSDFAHIPQAPTHDIFPVVFFGFQAE